MIHGIIVERGYDLLMCKMINREYRMSHEMAFERQALSTLVPDIQSILTKHGIEYTTNSKKTEIVVNSLDKSSMKSLLTDELDLPRNNIGVFLNVCSSKKRVYIRQRVR